MAFYVSSFVAGILSFLSPCILPLVPGYVSFVTGISLEEFQQREHVSPAVIMPGVIAFVLGFSAIFIGLGATASAIGTTLNNIFSQLKIAGGVIIILFGLHLTGVLRFTPFYRTHQIKFGKVLGTKRLEHPVDEKRSVSKAFLSASLRAAGSFLTGMGFGLGWTPCVGPVLGSILVLAANQETVGAGALLLTSYSLGIALPFIAISIALSAFLLHFRKIRKYIKYVELIAGVLLIAMGIWLIFGR
jgi:cytochrome c-type biogenesis protein